MNDDFSYYVDENGLLRMRVFTVYAEYFTLTSDRKLDVLIQLQDWIQIEMDKL